MSTITQTIVICDLCGARASAGANAYWARDRASEEGWQQMTRRVWDARTRRQVVERNDVCPECAGRLVGPEPRTVEVGT